MEHNDIIKALECCKTGYCYQDGCPLANDFDDDIVQLNIWNLFGAHVSITVCCAMSGTV